MVEPGFYNWGGGIVFYEMGGAHILFSGKKCIKLKEIGVKWGGGAHVYERPVIVKLQYFFE